MNDNKKTKTKTKTTKAIIAAATILAVVVSATMFGMQTQMLQYALAQTYGTTAASASASNPVIVNPSQTTSKEFWINTVHLDGATSLHAAVANPLSATNTPLHPGEVPPANSTIPTGGGFRIVLPNKVGAWDFR